jgi:hypothetical protein
LKFLPLLTENTRTLLPPLMVIKPPPSMLVLEEMVLVAVTVIVAEPPQLKVTVPLKLPPPGRQAFNAASVQLAFVPVPTTQARADEVKVTDVRSSASPKRLRRNTAENEESTRRLVLALVWIVDGNSMGNLRTGRYIIVSITLAKGCVILARGGVGLERELRLLLNTHPAEC